jgi:dCMP deaminase
MKTKWIDAFMDVAERFAQLSSSRRLRVGAVVVKDNRIISIGYNNPPSGWDNNCENEIVNDDGSITLRTKDETIHAEANAISKLARSSDGGDGAYLFCTHAPCIECAKLIYGAGIRRVFYRDVYKNDNGVDFLKRCEVDIEQYTSQYYPDKNCGK